MRFLTITASLLSVLAILGGPAQARDVMGQAVINGREALLYDDGFWRYAKAEEADCTVLQNVGALCSRPEDWSPAPRFDDPRRRYVIQPSFVQENGYVVGTVTSLTPYGGGEAISAGHMDRWAAKRLWDGGLVTPRLMKHDATVDNVPAETSAWDTPRGLVVLTLAKQNGRVIIAETVHPDTGLYGLKERATHQSLLDSIRLSPYPE